MTNPIPVYPQRQGGTLPLAIPQASALPLPLLLILPLLQLAPIPAASAGPLLRRAESRRACQEFAGKLQAVSGNPQQAQVVYQQGVLKLVQQFGSNPCTDIPAPAATAAPAPVSAPVTAPISTPAVPATTPQVPAAAAPAAKPASSQQQQACTTFASKLQTATASGNKAQAQQIYRQGLERLTANFGANPCPAVKPPL